MKTVFVGRNMKKNSNGRKNVLADKEVKCNGVTRENDTPNLEAVKNELEARLQRLENAHTTGDTDVYKFVFFFLMGVVLTVLIYPRISSSMNTAAVQSPNKIPAKNVNNGYNIEQIDELEEAEETITLDENQANLSKYSGIYKRSNDSGSFQKDVNEEPKQHDAQTKTGDKFNGKENKQSEETGNVKRDTDSVSSRSEEYNPKHERVEDLMMEEYEDSNTKSMPISFSPYSGDNNNLNADDKEDVKRVELFSGTIDDIPKVANKESDNLKANKQISDSTKNSQTSSKSKKGKESKVQTKSSNKNKKKDSISKVDEKIPKEIRDFKPTYLKELTPKKVFIDGRRIPPMELLPQKPNNSSVKVWLFEEFLSEEECDGLRRVHDKHVQEQSKEDPILCFDSIGTLRKHLKSVKKHVQVTPNDFTTGTTCVNASFSRQLKQWLKGNWSYSTAFYPGESRFASIFEQRVKQAMGLKPENGGKFQITSYPQGIGYKAHTDCTENSNDKRDRMATVLVYLDTVSEGGETEFTELGIWARPRKGRALLWNNMSPEGDCEPLSIHKANKVIDGHKYILQRWYYYKSFYSLGKRPPEPPLPERKPGQARVSCDEYEHGSCRWYDEWNFEHMIEYERQKYTLI